MKTEQQRVVRRARWWAVSTVVVLGILLALGYSLVKLIMGIPVDQQANFLYILGGIGIVWSFVLGQIVQHIAVRNWDTWTKDLGPTQISVLIPELEKQKQRLEKEEKADG